MVGLEGFARAGFGPPTQDHTNSVECLALVPEGSPCVAVEGGRGKRSHTRSASAADTGRVDGASGTLLQMSGEEELRHGVWRLRGQTFAGVRLRDRVR